jgi:hypothetical protein
VGSFIFGNTCVNFVVVSYNNNNNNSKFSRSIQNYRIHKPWWLLKWNYNFHLAHDFIHVDIVWYTASHKISGFYVDEVLFWHPFTKVSVSWSHYNVVQHIRTVNLWQYYRIFFFLCKHNVKLAYLRSRHRSVYTRSIAFVKNQSWGVCPGLGKGRPDLKKSGTARPGTAHTHTNL